MPLGRTRTPLCARWSSRASTTSPCVHSTTVPPSVAHDAKASDALSPIRSASVSSASTVAPIAAASGSSVSMQRTHGLDSRRTGASPMWGMSSPVSAAACARPFLLNGRNRSSPTQRSRRPARAWRTRRMVVTASRALAGGVEQRVENFAITFVGQALERLVRPQPRQPVDLAVGAERGALAVDLHRPVADDLGAAAIVRVVGRRQFGAELALVPRLLGDLADGGVLVVLAGEHLSLRQRPVVVVGPVHEEDLDVARPPPPHGTARGADDLLLDRPTVLYGFSHPRPRLRDALSQACPHARRHASASARCTAMSSPAASACAVGAPAAASRSHASATTASWRSPSTPCTSATAPASDDASLPRAGATASSA